MQGSMNIKFINWEHCAPSWFHLQG